MSDVKVFNNIKIHTQYSICEGAIKIEDLASHCKENKIQNVGICDTSNLCGALEFSEKVSKSGIQPIIGTKTTGRSVPKIIINRLIMPTNIEGLMLFELTSRFTVALLSSTISSSTSFSFCTLNAFRSHSSIGLPHLIQVDAVSDISD